MAKAITQVRRMELSEEERRQRDLQEIEAMLIEHKESLQALMNVLDKVYKSGGLDLAVGLFDQGDRVLDVLVKAVDNPGAAKTLKNGLLLVGTLGQLDVEKLGPVIERMNSGLDQVAQWSEGERSLAQILGKTNWKETLLFLLSFLKGVAGTEKKQQKKGKTGWIATAGLSIAGFMFMKKKGWLD
ncbi:DUF1641 domain-containing protein [Bacillus sp. FJAT-27231]|uniref:DUF1641 domain-containing protein n=1 Tax=Bacillus sp. FJAT-27231 TaxID=1679168 RepID=UPI0006717918|nr:DUF1641 domain-containing protein [Bacillus sp. FJAT-27231]